MVARAFAAQRSRIEQIILVIVLPWVAGVVNASGFFIVGSYTSHVTGQVARFGDELVQGHYHLALQALGIMGAFLGGAMTGTLLVEMAKRLARARYALPLLLEAGTLALFATTYWIEQRHHTGTRDITLPSLLGFAMGLQNAMVTRISGAVVRTTHLTGITTDIGIESVRALFWLRDELRSRHQIHELGALPQTFLASKDPELAKLRLHVAIFASFMSGAVLGPMLFLHYGGAELLLPVGVLLGLVAFDVRWGLHGPETHAGEASP